MSTLLFSVIKSIFARREERTDAAAGLTETRGERLKRLVADSDKAALDGNLERARLGYEEVLRADPDDLYVIYQLAKLHQRRRAFALAAETCERGLAVEADQVGLLALRADVASDLGEHATALKLYQRIQRLAPDFVNLDARIAYQYSALGDGAQTIAAFDRAIARDPAVSQWRSDRLFALNHFNLIGRQALFDEHRRWGESQELRLASARMPWANDANPERKLRVGYVSADLREHAVAFFIDGIFTHSDRGQFELHCFDASPFQEDVVTARLRTKVHRWHRVNALDDDGLAALIRSLQIDILVDLSGHTAHNRLLVFARKPAPVQVSWFGYMNTTGLSTIDYRLTDGFLDPIGESDRFYTERLFRIPSMACFTPHPESPAVGPLPALASAVFTFASVNQWTKITDEVKDLWASILKVSDRSRLLVVVRGGDVASVRDDVVAQFVRRGAKATQIVVYPTQPILDFLQLYSQIDVALDPFPYGGGTSSLHTIWMGVPIVTLEGQSEMSRSTGGILHAMGMQEWVAADADDYRVIALRAATSKESIAKLRQELRPRMRASSLTDADSVTRNVELAFRTMWHTYCET
jgi:predicted O-linked N-acetylglucosamine transferase (SPINDLY family)